MFMVTVGPCITHLGVWAEIETPVRELRWEFDLRNIMNGDGLRGAIEDEKQAELATGDYTGDNETFLRDAAGEVLLMFRSIYPEAFSISERKKAA